MIDTKHIKELALIVVDYSNNHIDLKEAKKKINYIFHNKSISTIFRELNTYNQNYKKGKNISTIIITIALYVRNLDDQEKIKSEIIKYNMTGALYGGLYRIFCSDSGVLKINFTLADASFSNKYEYLFRYFDYSNLRLTAYFKSIETLYHIDKSKFDFLAYSDKTKLILLNMVSFRLNIKPSKELLIQLVKDKDELNQNIALYFIMHKLDTFLCRYPEISDTESINKRKFNKELKEELTKVNSFISQCDTKTCTSLVLNFLLMHQRAYPECFARMLIDQEHQMYFGEQIRKAGKIRSLKEVAFVTDLIKRTPSLDDRKKRISKSILYEAITDLIISYIEEERGIYSWDYEQQKRFSSVCEKLPKRCLKRLLSFVKRKRSTLMCDQIDEMVRYKMFLKDKSKKKMFDGMQNIIIRFID